MQRKERYMVMVSICMMVPALVFLILASTLMALFPEKDEIEYHKVDGISLTFSLSYGFDRNDAGNVTFRFPDHNDLRYLGKWYIVDFGDGNSTGWTQRSGFFHNYSKLQQYQVVLHRAGHNGEPVVVRSYSFDLGEVGRMPAEAVIRQDNLTYYKSEQPVMLSGDGSYDLDGEVTGYFWDFGDGTFSHSNTGTDRFQSTKVASHVYEKSGRYIAKLYVIDDTGIISPEENTATVEVSILAHAC